MGKEKMGYEGKREMDGEGAAEVLRKYREQFARSGGRASARKMTQEERTERAKNAARVRWGEKKNG